MEQSIGNRYLLKKFIVPMSDGGMIYDGTDLSLKREVLLYRIDDGESSTEQHLRILGLASRLSDSRFMHILDVTQENGHIFAILKSINGKPLIHSLKHQQLTSWDIFSIVADLGKALLDAMEEGYQNFPVTANNLWLSDEGRLVVINYWKHGKERQRGVMGLTYLLYQLCTRSETIPVHDQQFETNLRVSLSDLTIQQKETVIAMIRRVHNAQDSLSAFIFHLRDLLRSRVSKRIEAVVESEEIDSIEIDNDDDEDIEPEKSFFRGKKFWIAASAVCILLLAGYLLKGLDGTEPNEKQSAPPKVNKTDATNQEKPQTTAPQEDNEEVVDEEEVVVSPADENSNEIPDLIGMTKEEAERSALSAGLHYKYFIENNEQPEGTVFKQDPEPGSQVPEGSNVTFWISRGN